MFPSRLRLRGAVQWYACRSRCRPGLSFLVALAAFALAAALAVFSLSILGLAVLGLVILALTALAVGTAAALARGEIGGRRAIVGADQNLGAVGQIAGTLVTSVEMKNLTMPMKSRERCTRKRSANFASTVR